MSRSRSPVLTSKLILILPLRRGRSSSILGTHAPATYASLTAKYTLPTGLFGFLPEGFAISGEVARYMIGTSSYELGRIRFPDYYYGNVGLSYTYKNLTFDIRYHDTDRGKRDCFTLTTDPRGVFTGSGRSNWCDARVIGTVSFDFTTKDPGLLASPSASPPGPPKEAGAGGERLR